MDIAGRNSRFRPMSLGPDALASGRPLRQRVPARSAWSDMLAYSRAVRTDRHVFVAGTLPVDAQGQLVGGDDAHLQARQVLRLILAALDEVGASASEVVRLRIYLKDYADFPAIARAQFEVFETIRPTCTFVQTGFVRPEFRVQMEADAISETPSHIAAA